MSAPIVSADEAQALLAETTVGPWSVSMIRDERAARDELGVIAKGDPRSHEKPDGTWHSAIICRGMEGPTREPNAQLIAAAPDLARTVVTLHRELAVLREQLGPLCAVHDALREAAALPGAGPSPEEMVAAVREKGAAEGYALANRFFADAAEMLTTAEGTKAVLGALAAHRRATRDGEEVSRG